jgi:hypothetical protein
MFPCPPISHRHAHGQGIDDRPPKCRTGQRIGPIDGRYNVKEMPSNNYPRRTEYNRHARHIARGAITGHR